MKVTIAESSMAATDLMNALQSINRERERISENRVAVQRFETCKQLRRKVLRYVSSLCRSLLPPVVEGYVSNVSNMCQP
jgi:hypothetical protein